MEIPFLTCDPNGPTPCPPCSQPPPDESRTVRPDVSVDPRAACILDSLLARFAVYEGDTEAEVDGRTERVPFPSARDMAFTWTVTGGFTSLRATLVSQTLTVSPVSLQFVPQLGQLAVVDGAAAGLSFISLETLGVSRLFF